MYWENSWLSLGAQKKFIGLAPDNRNDWYYDYSSCYYRFVFFLAGGGGAGGGFIKYFQGDLIQPTCHQSY